MRFFLGRKKGSRNPNFHRIKEIYNDKTSVYKMSSQGKSALDCVILDENRQEIMELWEDIAKILDRTELRMLIEYIVYNRTLAEVSLLKRKKNYSTNVLKDTKINNRYRNNGWYCIHNIINKVKNNLDMKKWKPIVEQILESTPAGTSAFVPKLAYPFDLAKNSFDGYKTDKSGTIKPITKCHVPEYLAKSFKCNGTICPYCGTKCTRKRVNIH